MSSGSKTGFEESRRRDTAGDESRPGDGSRQASSTSDQWGLMARAFWCAVPSQDCSGRDRHRPRDGKAMQRQDSFRPEPYNFLVRDLGGVVAPPPGHPRGAIGRGSKAEALERYPLSTQARVGKSCPDPAAGTVPESHHPDPALRSGVVVFPWPEATVGLIAELMDEDPKTPAYIAEASGRLGRRRFFRF